ncbi:hypothetical protein ACFSRY_13030 [Pontibacter locisalis]|uniref:Helitron helicase n=1 Tax=Pontibacter locisalis TaxID=1719035 RepID=A0ABW5IMA4_9BACT
MITHGRERYKVNIINRIRRNETAEVRSNIRYGSRPFLYTTLNPDNMMKAGRGGRKI